MNSLSGAAVLNRRKSQRGAEDASPVSQDALEWATISSSRSSELAGVKSVSFDSETNTLFAAHKGGAVLLWDWKEGQFGTFLEQDKDKGDFVHALLRVGNHLWVSSGKGKIILYDVDTLKVVTKVVAHTAEVYVMTKISGTGVARVLTGSIDFVIKIWDEDAMLVSHSSHHHGAILCALQVHHPREEAMAMPTGEQTRQSHPPQIWTGSNDGTVFKWNDINRDGKVSKDEGAILKHSSTEAVTCLEQVDEYIWAGTERGKLVIWSTDSTEEDSICEIPAHRERISSICGMGNSAWSAGADKTILVWSTSNLPIRPKMLYRVDVEIGYVKSMIKISWGVWVFHNKGLAMYTAASSLNKAQDRCDALKGEIGRLQLEIEGLRGDVANGKAVEESLEYQAKTLKERQEKASEELKVSEEKLASVQSELEVVQKKSEDSAREAGGDIKKKEDEIQAKQSELEACKQEIDEAKRQSEENEDRAREQERKLAEVTRLKEDGEAELETKLAEIEQMKKTVEEFREKEKQQKEKNVNQMEDLQTKLQSQLADEKSANEEERKKLREEFEAQLDAEKGRKASEMANLEKELLAQREEEIKRLRSELQTQLDAERKERESKDTEIENVRAELEAQMEAERKEREAKDTEMKNLKAELEAQLDAERKQKESEIQKYEKLAENSENGLNKLMEENEKERESLESKLAQAQQGHKSAQDEMEMLQSKIAGSAEQIKELQEQNAGLSEKATSMQTELSNKDQDLAARASEIESLQKSRGLAEEDTSKARSDLERAKQEMEETLNSERRELEKKVEEINESKEKEMQESRSKLEEARDRVSSLEESLVTSKDDQAKVQNENVALAEEIKGLRSNHAKSLLLAGTKHQELLARARKDMEEKCSEYVSSIQDRENQITDLKKDHSQRCGEYEERLKEVEQAREDKESELKAKAESANYDLERKEEECEQHKKEAAEKYEAYEEKIASQNQDYVEKLTELGTKLSQKDEELDQNRKAFEDQLQKAGEERLEIQNLYEESLSSAKTLEEELGKILGEFHQAEARIKEYQEMVNALREIHEEQTKILVDKHEKDLKEASDQMVQLKEDFDAEKENFEEKLSQQRKSLGKEHQAIFQKQNEQIEDHERKLQRQQEAFDANIKQILEKYKAEIEALNKGSKDIERKLLTHIQRIEAEKRGLETDLQSTRDELQKRIHAEEVLNSKVETLEKQCEELNGIVQKSMAEKERVFMELEDLRSLIESTRGANPLAYANMFHPDGIDVPLYMRTLKQDIFNTVSNLSKEISALKHEIDVNEKNILSLQEQVKVTEDALEKKRKKKRKWKMAYLRLSASQTEEINGLQTQLQHANEQSQNQQISYKKTQQALRQAAQQLQHARGLEGALDQAQEEYSNLLTKLSSVRQQAESEKRESQGIIKDLQSEISAKTRVFEQAMSEMNQEVNDLKKIKRQKEEQHAPYEAAKRLEREASVRREKERTEESPAPAYKEPERYSGFVFG